MKTTLMLMAICMLSVTSCRCEIEDDDEPKKEDVSSAKKMMHHQDYR